MTAKRRLIPMKEVREALVTARRRNSEAKNNYLQGL
jgi:hypothetical protein